MHRLLKKLPSQKELLEFFSYDDGNLRWKVRAKTAKNADYINSWNRRYAGKLAQSLTDHNYYRTTLKGQEYKTHRLIFKMFHGIDPQIIDHKDGNKTHNRIENLHSVTTTQNAKNKKRYRNNTSGFVGVSWDKHNEKWRVFGTLKGGDKTLGRFHDLEKAVNAAQEFRKENGYSERHRKIS